MESTKYRLNKEEGVAIAKVFGYTVASAVVVALISLLEVVEFAPEYAVAVSLANTVLYAVKKFLEGK